ncbi:MAG: glycoside hydrolase family 31 protein [Prolixibacteraceae bacterium]|jgi:alpha-glucosidase|nr:glycoside hydrolase family 31 protein [Prolixibacteraceae bacterium]
MGKAIITLILAFCSANIFAEKFVTEIKPMTGEQWYGAYTAKTIQPYGANVKKMDLNIENFTNQAAPLLISNMGRYVWNDKPFAFEFKEGSLILYSETEKLDAIASGKTLRDAYVAVKDNYFPASGKTPNPLMFKMPQYNTWIELGTNQNQKDIIKYADNVLKNGFPTGVFMIDDIWQKYYGNFEFDASKFSDPKGMVDYLHEKGFKIMLWLTPFISPDCKEFLFLEKEGCLVLNKENNSPAFIRWWNGYSACLDFTKPKANNWLKEQLKNLQQKYGIDGFKFDAADFDFYSKKPTNARGFEQAEMYAKLGTAFDFNEFRACWKMGNQPLAQRLVDKSNSWGDLKLLVPDMVSAGLLGHPFTCPDMIGGGLLWTFLNIDKNKFDQELMVRSAQIQALMPMMQFSVAPWRVLDDKHLSLCREAALLHAKMGGYIYELAQKAAKDGEPIVRHMEYSFPHQGFEACNDQYMFGENYLVAPMIDKGETRVVKLPKGNWVDDQGKKYKGGQSVTMNVPLNRLVYFVRQK